MIRRTLPDGTQVIVRSSYNPEGPGKTPFIPAIHKSVWIKIDDSEYLPVVLDIRNELTAASIMSICKTKQDVIDVFLTEPQP